MKLNGYQVVSESIDANNTSEPILQIIENQLGRKIDNLDDSLVNEYGATPEDIANIFIDIEEHFHVFLNQDIIEKETITPRFLIDSVMINLRDPQSRNRVVKQMATHIEVKESEDKFDQFRKTMGSNVVNTLLSKFGLGPDFVPQEPVKHECPKCHEKNAIHKELHPDTDMNEMVLKCPDCGYEKSI